MSTLAEQIDAIPSNDPEMAHGELDRLLLTQAPQDVQEAAHRLMRRCEWWAHA